MIYPAVSIPPSPKSVVLNDNQKNKVVWKGSYFLLNNFDFFPVNKKITALVSTIFLGLGLFLVHASKNPVIVNAGRAPYILFAGVSSIFAGSVGLMVLLFDRIKSPPKLGKSEVPNGKLLIEIPQKDWKVKHTPTHQIIKISNYFPSDDKVGVIRGLNDHGEPEFVAMPDFDKKNMQVITNIKFSKNHPIMIQFKNAQDKLKVYLSDAAFTTSTSYSSSGITKTIQLA